MRFSSNRRVIPEARTPAEALDLLGRIAALPGHVFWEDDISLLTSAHVARDKLRGHQQVTDSHLLALALRRNGRLATFDRGVLDLVPDGVPAEDAVSLLGTGDPPV